MVDPAGGVLGGNRENHTKADEAVHIASYLCMAWLSFWSRSACARRVVAGYDAAAVLSAPARLCAPRRPALG